MRERSMRGGVAGVVVVLVAMAAPSPAEAGPPAAPGINQPQPGGFIGR